MRVSDHSHHYGDHRSRGKGKWKVSMSKNEGAMKIRNRNGKEVSPEMERCLRGPKAGQSDTATEVQTQVCNKTMVLNENRFLFMLSGETKQIMFCHAEAAGSGGTCSWNMCLQAQSDSAGAQVERIPCNAATQTQKWNATKHTENSLDFWKIQMQTSPNLCLKLNTTALDEPNPKRLQLRTCSNNANNGWEEQWIMPYPRYSD